VGKRKGRKGREGNGKKGNRKKREEKWVGGGKGAGYTELIGPSSKSVTIHSLSTS